MVSKARRLTKLITLVSLLRVTSANWQASINCIVDYNKKSANAVDYEDIEELADDEARPISNAKFQVRFVIH